MKEQLISFLFLFQNKIEGKISDICHMKEDFSILKERVDFQNYPKSIVVRTKQKEKHETQPTLYIKYIYALYDYNRNSHTSQRPTHTYVFKGAFITYYDLCSHLYIS